MRVVGEDIANFMKFFFVVHKINDNRIKIAQNKAYKHIVKLKII